jgi:hypothetical protein
VDCAVTELPRFQEGHAPLPEPAVTNLTSFSKRPLPIKLSQIFNNSWYTPNVKGPPLGKNLSTGLSPFQSFTATTCLPPSRLLGVPSDQNSAFRNWPTDPKTQAQVNSSVEKDLKMWHEEEAKERKILVFGKLMDSMCNVLDSNSVRM